jgi:hypothetical protein
MSEEVAQEVLVEVWRTAARYRPVRGTAINWISRQAEALAEVLAASDARSCSARMAGGAGTLVVSDARDRAVFVATLARGTRSNWPNSTTERGRPADRSWDRSAGRTVREAGSAASSRRSGLPGAHTRSLTLE